MEKIVSLILRVTERCNLHCAYCYADTGRRDIPDMTEELAKKAVSLCCPQGGALRIQFTGGEPLLQLPLMEAVYAFGKATDRRLRLAVQTNGTLLTPETCRRLAAMQCAVGVSLDGLAAANALRTFPDGEPSFSAVVQGIRNLGQCGLRCNLTVVVTRTSAPYLSQLPDLALWLGNVTGVGLDFFRPLGRGKGKDLSPQQSELAENLRALCQRSAEIQAAGIPFRFRELERLKKRQACGACGGIYCYAQTDQSLAVDGAGNCWPCSSLTGQDGFLLGNILEGLPDLSQGNPGLEAPPACQSCPSFSLCLGGCPAGRTAFGDQPDRLTCVMQKVLFEEMIRDTH